jgi:hypothetical protein
MREPAPSDAVIGIGSQLALRVGTSRFRHTIKVGKAGQAARVFGLACLDFGSKQAYWRQSLTSMIFRVKPLMLSSSSFGTLIRMNLFIDTNVFLSFYHLSSDDLEELHKLSVLVEKKMVRLILPRQVRDEFRRNRDAKIADALKRFREVRLNLQYPQLCKDYSEYERLRELQKEFESVHKVLLDRMTRDVDSQSLKGDSTIQRLMKLADEVPLSDEILDRARKRQEVGNPPGKRDSLGDAINWESLLHAIGILEDIHIVSDDGDYSSELAEDRLHPFLRDEWAEEKHAEVHYYRRLSQFFKEHFPDIKLASEIEKDLAIRDLANSGSFASTHAAIARLNQFGEFNPPQAQALLDAALTNSQIHWIIGDADVHEFFSRLLARAGQHLDSDKRSRLVELLAADAQPAEDIG